MDTLVKVIVTLTDKGYEENNSIWNSQKKNTYYLVSYDGVKKQLPLDILDKIKITSNRPTEITGVSWVLPENEKAAIVEIKTQIKTYLGSTIRELKHMESFT